MPYIGNPIYQSAFVTDTFSGTGSATVFTMSVAPAGTSNVLVAVSGVLQDPSTYGVVGNTLTFSAAPPSGTNNISCRYLGVPVTGVTTTAYRTVTEFTATAGQTTFTPPSYNVGFINVYLNGVLLGSADYTATNGTTVVLTTGAAAGNLVTVEGFRISSVANAIANAAGSVSSSNIATGAVTPAKLSTGGPTWDTSSNFFVGTTSNVESGKAVVYGAKTYTSTIPVGQLNVVDSTAMAAGVGGAINFCGVYTSGGSLTSLASVEAQKADGTSGNYGGNLVFRTRTNGSTQDVRMTINSSGQITTPYQPGISLNNITQSFSSTWFNPTVYTTNYNVGGGFNPTGGPNSSFRYTAPITGSYFIQWNVMGNNGGTRMEAGFYLNGAGYVQSDSTTSNFTTASIVTITKLTAGDYLDFKLLSGDYFASNNPAPFLSIRLIG